MSDKMRMIPFRDLLLRCAAELRERGSIFDISERHFWTPGSDRSAPVFSSRCSNPIGPAAGPHTQLAQNILSAWLCGGRYVELKTVQKLDALAIEKPCIDAADEGYNVEWSTELSLEQAWEEYLKAWFAAHLFTPLLSRPSDTVLFNMSVGYDLAGIRSERMDRFIDRLIDASREPLFHRLQEESERLLADPDFSRGTPWEARLPSIRESLRDLPSRVPPRICTSVTLSTMHGCPPAEIESICEYLLGTKKLDTLVKLNPTLLGHERAREILDRLGYTGIRLKPEGFAADLQYRDAVPMLTRLLELGRTQGRHFGAKLSNTLAAGNHRGVLPGTEMYLSGRALYPLTMTLADTLASEFKGSLPLSFSGGAAAWNLAEILEAGIRPVTVATELLKPGGYARMKQLAEIAEAHADAWSRSPVDPGGTRQAAQVARQSPQSRKDPRGDSKVAVVGALPLIDCFVAPCIEACPIHQDVPEYVHLAGAGRMEEAFQAVYLRNPLPFMTGYLCDHQCQQNCTRRDWEGTVQIREAKRVAAEEGWEAFRNAGLHRSSAVPERGVSTAVIGAGPAGLAAAALLRREGFEVHVFEREEDPGGVVRYLLPGFRIPEGAIEKDVSLLSDLGVHFHFRDGARTIGQLRSDGHRYVLVGVGAEAQRAAGLARAREALSFLREFRRDPKNLRLGARVAVIGAGDTAMDAARAALRCPGVTEVSIVYRRTERQMPASQEEYLAARQEGVRFHFLRSPSRWSPDTGLLCQRMELGPADASGRARPEPTGDTEAIPADSVIAALGAEPDTAALAALGVGQTPVDETTQETADPGVFLLGDAAEGAATIVRAIASAHRAVDAIAAREGGPRFRGWSLPAEDVPGLRALRDRLRPPAPGGEERSGRAVESRRCLGCRALCMKCVEVCPNRANTLVVVPGLRDAFQVVHLDALCNECGNCATFCPWEGRPYRDKLTVFATAEDFADSTNPGFFLRDGKGTLRLHGRTTELRVGPQGPVAEVADPQSLAVIHAILQDYPWLLGGAS